LTRWCRNGRQSPTSPTARSNSYIIRARPAAPRSRSKTAAAPRRC
jgi:hypothetical protein